ITKQEAHLAAAQQEVVQIPELLEILLEQIVFEARQSAYVDAKSGVSARLSISAYENLVSAAERRALLNQESHTHARIADLWGVIPAITGKIELVYEGEQEGSFQVAVHLLDQALKTVFLRYFPDPDKLRKGKDRDPYGVIRAWFSSGNQVDILQDASNQAYQEALDGVAGLRKLATAYVADDSPLLYTYMELLLHGLASCQVLNKDILEYQLRFRDPLAGMLGDEGEDDDDFDEEDFN
ncbi:MAG: magnesium chelatase, partial [Haliscomenobacter sp.]